MTLINFKCNICNKKSKFELSVKKHEKEIIQFEENPYSENCALTGKIGEIELIKEGQRQIAVLFSKLNKGGKKNDDGSVL